MNIPEENSALNMFARKNVQVAKFGEGQGNLLFMMFFERTFLK